MSNLETLKLHRQFHMLSWMLCSPGSNIVNYNYSDVVVTRSLAIADNPIDDCTSGFYVVNLPKRIWTPNQKCVTLSVQKILSRVQKITAG